MISVRRAADRYRTDVPGITSFHCFASGGHYDPDNLSFGPVIACDEHLLDPGAGFAPHPHARVELVSWVLDGALQHEDGTGRTRVVLPGRAQHQLAGGGIRHAERNASDRDPLHFVQLWLLTDENVSHYDLRPPPVQLSSATFDVLRACHDEPLRAQLLFLFVAAGAFGAGDVELRPGDSVRARDETVQVTGNGQLLVIRVEA